MSLASTQEFPCSAKPALLGIKILRSKEQEDWCEVCGALPSVTLTACTPTNQPDHLQSVLHCLCQLLTCLFGWVFFTVLCPYIRDSIWSWNLSILKVFSIGVSSYPQFSPLCSFVKLYFAVLQWPTLHIWLLLFWPWALVVGRESGVRKDMDLLAQWNLLNGFTFLVFNFTMSWSRIDS